MLSPLSISLLRPSPLLTSRTLLLLPLQHRSQTTAPPPLPRSPPPPRSPFPTTYQPYTPKPRPPTPIKNPSSAGLHPWATSRPGSVRRVGFETLGGGGSTEGMSLGEKLVHHVSRLNYGGWFYTDQQGWKPLAFKFEVVFLFVLFFSLYKWNEAADNTFRDNPIDYNIENKMAEQWNRASAANARWRKAGPEERELIAKEEAQHLFNVVEGKVDLPVYPPDPNKDKHWWNTW